jgi:hypothetical protein
MCSLGLTVGAIHCLKTHPLAHVGGHEYWGVERLVTGQIYEDPSLNPRGQIPAQKEYPAVMSVAPVHVGS